MMEMPVPCDKCNEWVELNDCRESELTKRLLCPECTEIENEVEGLRSDIEFLQCDLECDPENYKGRVRETKREIKDKKARIVELGYNYDDLQ